MHLKMKNTIRKNNILMITSEITTLGLLGGFTSCIERIFPNLDNVQKYFIRVSIIHFEK